MNLWFFSYGLQSPEILLIRGPEEYHQKSHVRRLDSHHLQPIHPLEKYNYNCERLEIADIGQLHQFWFKKKKKGGLFYFNMLLLHLFHSYHCFLCFEQSAPFSSTVLRYSPKEAHNVLPNGRGDTRWA